MPFKTFETGTNQRLPADGRGVYKESGKTETSR